MKSKVTNFGLHVHKVRPYAKGTILSCSLIQNQNLDGSYPKPLYISVFVTSKTDSIQVGENDNIVVTGRFSHKMNNFNESLTRQYMIGAETIRRIDNFNKPENKIEIGLVNESKDCSLNDRVIYRTAFLSSAENDAPLFVGVHDMFEYPPVKDNMEPNPNYLDVEGVFYVYENIAGVTTFNIQATKLTGVNL